MRQVPDELGILLAFSDFTHPLIRESPSSRASNKSILVIQKPEAFY